jgi:hypothetical protein
MSNKIIVHEKALGHLSKGLYRSPASAIRELVSNAWDANATKVRVDTNCPNFFRLSVSDNGDGFSKEEFERLMSGNIGNSEKRLTPSRAFKGRPMIGRLGIGMLGIAQICPSFVVKSKPKKGKPFAAKVVLFDSLKTKLDDKKTSAGEPVQVGTYDFIDEALDDREHGTLIFSDDLSATFTDSFTRTLLKADPPDGGTSPAINRPPRDWSKFLAECEKKHSLRELGDYWRLIWELAASVPVPYLDDEAVPSGLAKEDHQRLLKYDFQVIVDDIDLRKPVYLKGNKEGYTARRINFSEQVYGKDISIHGYLAVQEGLQLKPDELRGVLVRIKNVGIGYYDSTLLDYRTNEGPRSRWVTGEIYVDKGLEDALNIDRDSFNRFHPEFRAIQDYLHSFLKTEIFKVVYQNLDLRSKKRNKARERKRHDAASEVFAAARLEVKEELSPTERRSVPTRMASVPDNVRVRDKQAELLKSVLTIFDLAIRLDDPKRQRDFFVKKLAELLGRW